MLASSAESAINHLRYQSPSLSILRSVRNRSMPINLLPVVRFCFGKKRRAKLGFQSALGARVWRLAETWSVSRRFEGRVRWGAMLHRFLQVSGASCECACAVRSWKPMTRFQAFFFFPALCFGRLIEFVQNEYAVWCAQHSALQTNLTHLVCDVVHCSSKRTGVRIACSSIWIKTTTGS